MRHQNDTAAGFIVYYHGDDGCRYLLLLSRLTKRPLWEFPKGGIDEGETVFEAALRELEEETGLAESDIDIVSGFRMDEEYRFMVGRGGDRTLVHKRVTYFLAEARHLRVEYSEAEAQDYAWVDFEEAVRRVRYKERRAMLRSAAEKAGCGERGGE